jgi:hypothetical protein
MSVPFVASLLAVLAAPAAPPLRVRATEAMAPCVAAAAKAFAATGGRAAAVETGDLKDATADVLVGSGPEVTRALESGLGRDDSDVAIAEVPWVLVLSEAAPAVASLEEAVRAGLEVDVLSGPASYEARRALASKSSRLRESDLTTLRKAPAALVPLSLAGPGRRVAVDVPALVAQAAVGVSASAPDGARAFVAFLGSDEGRRAFAACGSAQK